jgi:phosphoglucomutase/phosphomannomutase
MEKKGKMKESEKRAAMRLLSPLTSVVGLFLRLEDPLQLASQIVEEAAERYNADISTLFQVENGGKRLVLKGGVLFDEGRSLEPVVGISYKLPWGAKNWGDPRLRKKGVTAGVAVLNQELAIDSFEELRKNPAHLGRWDRHIYPKGPEDLHKGFGCLHAVPLRFSDSGDPQDIVIGVFKIERRREGPTFNDAERAAFVVVAAHLNQILRFNYQVHQLIISQAEKVLRRVPLVGRNEMERCFRILSTYAERRQERTCGKEVILDDLKKTLPEAIDWINEVVKGIPPALGYVGTRRRFFPVLRTLRVVPLQAKTRITRPSLVRQSGLIEKGFAKIDVPQETRDAALRNFKQWYDAPHFTNYRAQLECLMEEERWEVLLDSFYRVLPFGTSGRRGPVGIGPNRFNPTTLESSVQGHVEYIRDQNHDKDLSVVVAYDVRAFHDLRGIYNPNLPNPLRGITSRHFAHLAAGVYAANGVKVWMLPEESTTYLSTPELSFTIRRLNADGGLNISASHNHPDDNGGKFYGAHGDQEVPPNDQKIAKLVEGVDRIPSLPLDEARSAGLLDGIFPDIHEEYIKLNVAQSLHPTARGVRVVFTPLHGTGNSSVGEVLRAAGFEIFTVAEQLSPDGSFPAVPFRIPNPELPQSMQAGIDLALKVDADVVFACDPDADRIGVCSKTRNGMYHFFSGNEIAIIITHYKLESLRKQNRLPSVPLVIKSEVTTELLSAITKNFGGIIIGDLLVGIKYHVDVLAQLEKKGRFKDIRANIDDFVVAVEESHGVLVTSELREKDAAGAAILFAELAALQRDEGRTLVDYLYKIYLDYGYYGNLQRSIVMSGAVGLDNIRIIQNVLRERPPSRIANQKVVLTLDHQDPRGIHGKILSETDRLARNVLVFRLVNGARVTIRPSGTEPKIKIYVEVPSHPLGEAADQEVLLKTMAEIDSMAKQIADDFIKQILMIIGVQLPDYALRISDLVALDKRIEFAKDFLPNLEIRAQALSRHEVSNEEISRWIDESLSTYGQDARGLVAEAVKMYLDIEQEKATSLSIEKRHERMKCLDAIRAFFF